jgi:hypothetical protein
MGAFVSLRFVYAGMMLHIISLNTVHLGGLARELSERRTLHTHGRRTNGLDTRMRFFHFLINIVTSLLSYTLVVCKTYYMNCYAHIDYAKSQGY